jgi:3-oxoacyl-[acyl-carrier-protein] synthase-1
VHEAIYSLLMLDRGFLAESANVENLMDEAKDLNILTKRWDGQVNGGLELLVYQALSY